MQSSPKTTTTINKTELPAWVNKAAQGNYDRAQQIADMPNNFYQGPRVADLSPEFDQAKSIFERIGAIDTSYRDITPGSVTSGNVNAGSDITAGMLRDTDLSPYLNPYLAEVENNALNTLDRSRQLSLTGNSDAAQRAGAFGGSRHGIIDAVTNAETAREAGILSAGIRSEGFNNAQAAAIGDINRQLGVDQYNRDTRIGVDTANTNRQTQVDTDNANRDMQGQLANQSAQQTALEQMFRNLNTSATGLLGIGGTRQAHEQAKIAAEREKFNEPRAREVENLNLLLTSLGMSPYGQSSTQQTTQPQQGTDFGTLGLGLASLFFGLSDDDSKEDKVKVGETDSGLGIWSFRYKGDPKDYPKSVGLMASEIEEKHPEHVKKLAGGGTRIVDYAGLESKGLLAGALS